MIDVREKPEHDFTADDPCYSCQNCQELQIQLRMQAQQVKMSDSEFTMQTNELKHLLSKMQTTKETNYAEVICIQDDQSVFENSFMDVNHNWVLFYS